MLHRVNMYCALTSINRRGAQRWHHGFSLIELMVAVVIGLLTSIAIAQIYGTWVKQSRTVSSTNDAQGTVALAAFALEEDLKQAGQGIGTASSTTAGAAGCPITGAATVGGTTATVGLDPSGTGNLVLSGIQIVDGGADGSPDQIAVMYGNSSYRVGPEIVLASAVNNVRVRNRAGFNNGDIVVLVNSNASDCRLVEITSTDPAILFSDKAFRFDTSSYQALKPDGTSVNRTPVFNQAGGVVGATFASAFSLGQTPQANQWRVSTASPNSAVNPALQRFSIFPVNGAYPTPRAREVAEGVIDLQAQYGYDANGDGRIDAGEWVDADANHAPKITAGVLDWRRVLAIRYAVLARSRNFEPPPYVAIKPTWAGATIDPADSTGPVGFHMTAIGGTVSTNTGDASDWHQYRYSVAEGVIPLRNVLWGRNQ